MCIHSGLVPVAATVSEHENNYAHHVPSHVVQLYMLRPWAIYMGSGLYQKAGSTYMNNEPHFIAASIYEKSRR